MAWYEDLTPCDYFGTQAAGSLRSVGWLQKDRPYPTGTVAAEVFAKLVELTRDPWQPPSVTPGVHPCEICLYRSDEACSENLFVPGDGFLFVSPKIITHDMNAHGYLPPPAFCLAVLACPPMRSMAYLKSLLVSGGRSLMGSIAQ